jgi:hypothetical protein
MVKRVLVNVSLLKNDIDDSVRGTMEKLKSHTPRIAAPRFHKSKNTDETPSR